MDDLQQIASSPISSVWVGASAGTGKTKILTDRVLRLLLNNVAPSKILCLTFTKAAAAEMSLRINDELSLWVTTSESNLIKRLTKLTGYVPDKKQLNFARKLFVTVLDAYDNLKIQTIHSFCQFLIKKFPFEAEINPNFQVIDDQNAKLLIKEAKNNLFRKIRAYEEKPDIKLIQESINYISWNVSEDGFDELIAEIIEKGNDINKFLSSYQDIDSILAKLCKKLDFAKYPDEKQIFRDFCQEHKHFEYLEKNVDNLSTSINKKDKDLGERIKSWLKMNEEERVLNIIDYQNNFLTKELEGLKNIISKKLMDKHPALYENLILEQNRIINFIEKQKSLKLYIQSMHIVRFASEILKEYKLLKEKLLYLDYNDLISITYKLLANNNINDWILYKLDGGIDHILVDEAQDTSKEQWQIIENLSNEFFSGVGAREQNRTLFVVGDEKQSIFSFQGADPTTFKYMHDHFKYKSSHKDDMFKSIKLEVSFRSTRAVLTLVDKIFADKELLKSIQIDDNDLTHKAYRNLDAGTVRVWPLVEVINKDEDDQNQIWPLPGKRIIKENPSQKLAELIAIEIKSWFDNKKILKSKSRPIKAKDIMILVRRRNEFIDFLIKELKKRNLPVSGADRLVLTEHIAIMDLISLGKFLLLPYDDLNLACLLKSPLIGLSEEDLFTLACNRPTSLWESLIKNKDNKEIFTKTYKYLSSLFEIIDISSAFNLYVEIIENLGGRKKFLSRLGFEVDDILDEFLNLALKYESNHISSLQSFIHWIETTKIEIKRDLEQGKDQIRIMTVHSAKGLQAPIVFLPDTNFVAKNFDHLSFCKDSNLLYWPGVASTHNKISKNIKELNQQLEQNEANRLLYVALTRAEDDLIICGYKNRSAASENSWYNIIKTSISSIAYENEFVTEPSIYNYIGNKIELILTCEQEKNILETENIEKPIESNIILPKFLTQNIDEDIIPQKISPSNLNKEKRNFKDKNCSKGILAHKLLELLPNAASDKRKLIAKNYLMNSTIKLDTHEIDNIIDKCISLIENKKLSKLWGSNSKAEVEISGIVQNNLVSGQIDRLVVVEDKITIIDYKTNKNPPDSLDKIEDIYLKQMALYRNLLTNIYNREIECILIWTSNLNIIKIPDHMFESVNIN